MTSHFYLGACIWMWMKPELRLSKKMTKYHSFVWFQKSLQLQTKPTCLFASDHIFQVLEMFSFCSSFFLRLPWLCNISSLAPQGFAVLLKALVGLWKARSAAPACKQLCCWHGDSSQCECVPELSAGITEAARHPYQWERKTDRKTSL